MSAAAGSMTASSSVSMSRNRLLPLQNFLSRSLLRLLLASILSSQNPGCLSVSQRVSRVVTDWLRNVKDS